MNLAMSQIMDGANFWDAPGHSMGGSNDLPTRKKILTWIGTHDKTFYLPRSPIDPIGVYFSPETRNFGAKEFLESYRGVLILLMQKHLEFQIVTPRTLADFHGQTLVLPDVRALSDAEKSELKSLTGRGARLVINGKDSTGLGESASIVRFADDPGKAYSAALEKDFDQASPESAKEFLASLRGGDAVKLKAGTHVATSISESSEGRVQCFFANFSGLKGGVNPVQTPERGAEVTVKAKTGAKGTFLPFLGEAQEVKGTAHGDEITFTLPAIEKGAVFSYGK